MQVGAVKPSTVPSGSEIKQQEFVSMANTAITLQEPGPSTVDRAEIEKAVINMNKTVEIYKHDIKFEIHEQTHRIMIQVINKNTDEVISELPPKKILDMVAAFQELVVGFIIDKKA